jgi:hypothetical protein
MPARFRAATRPATGVPNGLVGLESGPRFQKVVHGDALTDPIADAYSNSYCKQIYLGVASMRRVLRVLLLVLAVWALLCGAASAHTIQPVITFEPEVPQPGQTGTLEVRLRDSYGVAIPAKVRATMSAIDELPPAFVPLTEQPPGIHTAKFRFPETVGAQLRVEVDLPDGTSQGHLMFRVGDGGFAVKQIPVDLFHEGETGDNGKPYGTPAAPVPAAPGGNAAGRPFPWGVAGGLFLFAVLGGVVILRKRR